MMKRKFFARIVASRRGFSLVETVTYVALFGFVASMATPLIFDCVTANTRMKRSMDHVIEMDWLNRLFRADVKNANEIVPEYASFELGAATLILRSSPAGPHGVPMESKEEYIVYSIDKEHPSRLVRTASSWGPEGLRTTSKAVARDLEKVQFVYGLKNVSEKTAVELRIVFEKGIIHKNKPMFYSLFGIVGE